MKVVRALSFFCAAAATVLSAFMWWVLLSGTTGIFHRENLLEHTIIVTACAFLTWVSAAMLRASR
jgi:hypothetical protein